MSRLEKTEEKTEEKEETGTRSDDRQPGSHPTLTPPGHGWTGMLGGTSRGTNHDYELHGINQRGSGLTGCNEPDPVTSRLA